MERGYDLRAPEWEAESVNLRRGSGGRPFVRFGAEVGAVEDEPEKIDEDEDVDGEKANADPGDAAEVFEDFPGQEGGRDGESEELAPGLFEIQADPFSEGDGGIREGDQADAAQGGVVEERGFLEEKVDEA